MPFRLRWVGLASGLSVLAAPIIALGGPPLPDIPITFPAGAQTQDILDWLHQETDISPESVVAVDADGLVAVMQTQPLSSDRSLALTVRGETLDPQRVARDGVASWHATVQVACQDRRVRFGARTVYGARNLLFQGRSGAPAGDWESVRVGTLGAQIWAASCDLSFRLPLTGQPRLSESPASEILIDAKPAADPPATALPAAPSAAAHTPTRASLVAAEPQIAAPLRSTRLAAPVLRPSLGERPAPAPHSSPGPALQVFAATSKPAAEQAWREIHDQFEALLGARPGSIVTVDIAGRRFYRVLITGFANSVEAEQTCAQLKAARTTCFLQASRAGLPAP